MSFNVPSSFIEDRPNRTVLLDGCEFTQIDYDDFSSDVHLVTRLLV